MGIDGFSLRNLGLGQDKMSSHMATEADFLAAREFSDEADFIDASLGQQKIGRKEDDYGEDKSNQSYSGGDTSLSSENINEIIDDDLISDEEDDGENDRRYVVIHNDMNNKFELHDTQEELILETLSVDELSFITDKLDKPSGLFINKKV